MSEPTLEITIDNQSSKNLSDGELSAIMSWETRPPNEIPAKSSASCKAVGQSDAGGAMIMGLYSTPNQAVSISGTYNPSGIGAPTGLHAFSAGLSGLNVSATGITNVGDNATGTVTITDS